MTTPRQQMRNVILRQAGVSRAGRGRLVAGYSGVPKTDRDHLKTFMMRYLEERHGKTIEELLDTRRQTSKVAKELGIPMTNVTNWRVRLGLTQRKPRRS